MTLILSASSQATLPFVIPFYHALSLKMHAFTNNRDNDLKLRQAVAHAIEKLKKYKDIADGNQYTRLATSTVHSLTAVTLMLIN